MKPKKLSKKSILLILFFVINLIIFIYAIKTYAQSQYSNFIEKEKNKFYSQVNELSYKISVSESSFHSLVGFLLSNQLDNNLEEKMDDYMERHESDFTVSSRILISTKNDSNYVYPKGSASDELIDSRITEFNARLRFSPAINKLDLLGPLKLPAGDSEFFILQQFIANENRLLGAINVFIPFEKLVDQIYTQSNGNALAYSIRNTRGKTIFGEDTVFDDPDFTSPIVVPGGKWQIAASIKDKSVFYDSILETLIFSIFLISLASIFTYAILNRNRQLENLVDLKGAELEDSTSKFDSFIQYMPFPIAFGEKNGNLLYSNIDNKALESFLPPENKIEALYREKHISYEESIEHDGKNYVYVTHNFLIDQTSEPLLASVRFDITKMKKTSQALTDLLNENEKIYFATIKSLANTIDAKDTYTMGHCRRVSHYAAIIANEMNLSSDEITALNYAANIHDIGKIGVEENILNKPGKLTESEYEHLKKHSEIGYTIVKDINFLKPASQAILQHHERYDGTGYPNGKSGDDINLLARILAVSDAYDAMTTKRVYRKRALTKSEALKEIHKNKNTQFDPAVADAFIKAMEKNIQFMPDILQF